MRGGDDRSIDRIKGNESSEWVNDEQVVGTLTDTIVYESLKSL